LESYTHTIYKKNNIYQVLTDLTEHRVFAPSEQAFDKDVTVFYTTLCGVIKMLLLSILGLQLLPVH